MSFHPISRARPRLARSRLTPPRGLSLTTLALSLHAGGVFAQSAGTPEAASGAAAELPDPNDRSNSFTIAAGVASVPDYEGADEQRMTPAVAIRGRVAGMDFWSNATWLYLDVIAPSSGGMDFDLGPIVGARFNRTCAGSRGARLAALRSRAARVEGRTYGARANSPGRRPGEFALAPYVRPQRAAAKKRRSRPYMSCERAVGSGSSARAMATRRGA